MTTTATKIGAWLVRPVGILPLVVFRVVFGVLMLVSMGRFWAKGWIESCFLEPKFHFHYDGFGWVEPLGGWGMYGVFAAAMLCCIFIVFGLFYRASVAVFFVLFSYVELIEKAMYLNHYYFISLLSFLLIFLPLGANGSVDAWLFPSRRRAEVPRWTIFVLQLQLGIVYFYAGVAKLGYDWLVEALPLRIWLASKEDFPLIGGLLAWGPTAYLMSWAGAVYDLSIAFLLWGRKTRPYAYVAVWGFHLMTGVLFPIGMFPYIMIAATTIFFSAEELNWLRRPLRVQGGDSAPHSRYWRAWIPFFVFQMLFPLRHWLYSGNVLWTEKGFRYSWMVMLVEKTGYVEFKVTQADGKSRIIYPRDSLTQLQYQEMSYQPDMILEYKQYLEKKLNAKIEAECFVSVNGKKSRRLELEE